MNQTNNVHISEAVYGLSDWFKERYCQLFLIVANGKVKPEGSGFLLRIKDKYFLITAGHVIADGRHNNICFPNLKTGGMTNFKGTWFPSDRIDNIGQDVDDFAYLVLPLEIVEKLRDEGYKFIQQANINTNHTPSENDIYTMIGCKWRKTKKKGIDHYSTMEILTNLGAQKHHYEKEENSKDKIIIRNNKKMLNPQTANQQIVGRLEGMSGGPVWHTSLNHYYSQNNPSIEVVGILVSYEYERICSCNINRLFSKLKERNHL